MENHLQILRFHVPLPSPISTLLEGLRSYKPHKPPYRIPIQPLFASTPEKNTFFCEIFALEVRQIIQTRLHSGTSLG